MSQNPVSAAALVFNPQVDARLIESDSRPQYEEEELWDDAITALLDAGDIEGARAEFERQCLVSLDSGEPILMTPEKWEELRLELHREAKLSS